MEDKYKRMSDETFLDYAERLLNGREKGVYDLDKIEIYEILFNVKISPDEARKRLYFLRDLIKVLQKEKLEVIQNKSELDKALEIIGEMDVKTQVMRNQRSNLNKLKKDFIPAIAVSQELKKFIKDNNFTINIPEYCFEPIETFKDNKMIVHITDWHIGYIINNCKGNYYNLQIAKTRIKKLIKEIDKYCKLYNINKIYVISTGDMIEHTYMRKNQSQFCEFSLSQQINEAKRLLYYFLCALCKIGYVEYDSIAGNHDRMNGDRKEVFKGDNADIIIKDDLMFINEMSKNKRLNIVKRNPLDVEIIKEINGTKHKFIHGHDKKAKSGQDLLLKEMSMDNDFYTLWRGHYHNFNIQSENNGRYIISTGCLSGFNDYSTHFGCATWASQTIGIISDGKIELIKDIGL